jgi:hypothetical protein
LLGYSQKSFCAGESGIAKFRGMEMREAVADSVKPQLPELCLALCQSAQFLLDGLPDSMLESSVFENHILLTYGPQLRGGANVKFGTVTNVQVFNVIIKIVEKSIVSSSRNRIEVKNGADRKVDI